MFLCVGCQCPGSSCPSSQQHASALTRDARQLRVAAVGRQLAPVCQEKTIRVSIQDTDEVGAYGWRNGNIFLTRGLIDRVNDAELAAAAAHELGHLLGDGVVRPVVSLRGCKDDLDVEARADAIGVEVLEQQGIAAEAMESMLVKVRDFGPPDCAQGIARRIARLAARRTAATGRG